MLGLVTAMFYFCDGVFTHPKPLGEQGTRHVVNELPNLLHLLAAQFGMSTGVASAQHKTFPRKSKPLAGDAKGS